MITTPTAVPNTRKTRTFKKKSEKIEESPTEPQETADEKEKELKGKKKGKKSKEKSPEKENQQNGNDENMKTLKKEKKLKGKRKEEEEETPTPRTPQKQRTQPQNPDLSASKTLARLNLFAENAKTESQYPLKSVTPVSLFNINPAVRKAYKLIQKATGALGGNGTTGAIYGELTMHSMQKVINYMIENCELSSNSRFIDVGSGLGKPNFHAAQDPCCRISIGIELEDIRWQLAMQNLKYLIEEMSEDAHLSVHADSDDRDVKLVPGVNFLLGDIFDVATTDPFTHIYMYDLGFPPHLQQKIAEHFNESTHARYLVSYRPPRRVIHEYGYAVTEIGKINTSMTGSGENHTAYFYKRNNTPAPCQARPNTTLYRLPPRPSYPATDGEEAGELVVCSNKFLHCIQLAVGPLESCQAYVNDITSSLLQSGRPKRERKPRVFLDAR